MEQLSRDTSGSGKKLQVQQVQYKSTLHITTLGLKLIDLATKTVEQLFHDIEYHFLSGYGRPKKYCHAHECLTLG